MDPAGDGFDFLDMFGGERNLDFEGWWRQASETLGLNAGR
jgi:hypothetical protein